MDCLDDAALASEVAAFVADVEKGCDVHHQVKEKESGLARGLGRIEVQPYDVGLEIDEAVVVELPSLVAVVAVVVDAAAVDAVAVAAAAGYYVVRMSHH